MSRGPEPIPELHKGVRAVGEGREKQDATSVPQAFLRPLVQGGRAEQHGKSDLESDLGSQTQTPKGLQTGFSLSAAALQAGCISSLTPWPKLGRTPHSCRVPCGVLASWLPGPKPPPPATAIWLRRCYPGVGGGGASLPGAP